LRTSCYIQSSGGASILVDASPDFRTQALREGISRLDAVFYTHAHADHILGTEDLRGLSYVRSSALPCYAERHTATELTRAFSYIFHPDPEYIGGGLPRLDLIGSLLPEDPVAIADLLVKPFRLYHGHLPILGYRIGSFVYATDCNRIPEESWKYFENAEVLFIDGLRRDPHPTHFSIAEAIAVAQKVGAQRTWLIHLTHTVDYTEESARLPNGIALAYDGLKISVAGEPT
jgi:phosphoribosyl 1,2-cyclic phosphate phosphodiesterase